MTWFLGSINTRALTNIRNWHNTNSASGFRINKRRGRFAIIFHTQGAMPDRAMGGGGKSICKATIRFGNDEQSFFIGRRIKTSSRHPQEADTYAKNLARAEVGVIAG